MITGIEDLPRTKQKAALEFISSEFDLDEAIKIDEEDDNIILINDNRYFVINPYEENELIDDVDSLYDEYASLKKLHVIGDVSKVYNTYDLLDYYIQLVE